MELTELSLDGYDSSRGSFSEIGTDGGARGVEGVEKQDLLSSGGSAGGGYANLNDGDGGVPMTDDGSLLGSCDRFLSSVLPGPRCVRNILGTELCVLFPPTVLP